MRQTKFTLPGVAIWVETNSLTRKLWNPSMADEIEDETYFVRFKLNFLMYIAVSRCLHMNEINN